MQGRLHLLFKIGVQVIYINACTTFHQFSLHMQHNGPDSVYLYEKSALLMRMVRRESSNLLGLHSSVRKRSSWTAPPRVIYLPTVALMNRGQIIRKEGGFRGYSSVNLNSTRRWFFEWRSKKILSKKFAYDSVGIFDFFEIISKSAVVKKIKHLHMPVV